MQRLPICLTCDKPVEYDPIYEAPCGHDTCPSAVFHGLCLMEWRDHREQFSKRMKRRMQQAMEAIGIEIEFDDGTDP